ncbi:MAG TPA: SDR family oxidoreductase [Streptosporangiaceae bacterium]|jgi:putative NADH-flavin reductase
MQLAILGGSGRIGSHVLTWALESGHDVRALARNPQSLPDTAGVGAAGLGAAELTVVTGDATDSYAVAEAVAGADAVLSALGPRGPKSPDLLATAARNVVDAMDKAGARRLICVSAAGAFIQGDPNMGALMKWVLPRLLAKTFADVREMESIVAATDLDWTMVRASRLVDRPLTGQYRVQPDYPAPGGRKISRADVAHFMASVLIESSWIRGTPTLAY